jgi:hypothetical protein
VSCVRLASGNIGHSARGLRCAAMGSEVSGAVLESWRLMRNVRSASLAQGSEW